MHYDSELFKKMEMIVSMKLDC